MLSGCESGIEDYDQIWDVWFFVTNDTSSDLMIEASGELSFDEQLIKSGETVEVANYSRFLAPDPSIDREFWCISVRRSTGREIVAQFAPASTGKWSRKNNSRFAAEFTLTVEDEDLGVIEVLCPRMIGNVRDAENDTMIQDAVLHVRFAVPYYESQFRTNEYGFYVFWLPRDLPSGELIVGASGYRALRMVFPDSVPVVGTNVYGGDFLLRPEDP